MSPAEARQSLAELQAARGVKPRSPQPVTGMEELLDIVQRDDIPRFDDATRFLEGKGGIDPLTMNATIELLWSDAYGTISLVAREFGKRAGSEADRLDEKQKSGREFTEQDRKLLEQAKKNVEFNAKAEVALGVLSRDHLATGSELAREAIRQFPTDPRTYRVAAFYYLMTGAWDRYDDAMKWLAEGEANDAGLLFLRALEALKRNVIREEARQYLSKALTVNPKLVRAQAKLVLIQEDIGATHAELLKLEAMAPEHPIVRIVGPSIKDEYALSQSFEHARETTVPAQSAPTSSAPPAPAPAPPPAGP